MGGPGPPSSPPPASQMPGWTQASAAAEPGSLEDPPWAKPCHVLGLGKRGGVLWLGTEDSRGPGGNFDSGCSALAGIRQAPGGKPLQLLPSRDAPTPAVLREEPGAPGHRSEGIRV